MANSKSVLLKTSAATDVICSGGEITITGLKSIRKKDITSFKQILYKAEVPQVITIGASSYTPTADTIYAIEIFDPNRKIGSYQEQQKVYSYRTTATLTGTAAQQREVIHAALVVKINADSSNRSVAASNGTGTGFTITDDGVYYSVRSQSMTNVLGANTVLPKTNTDGTGFAYNDYAVTTAAVASFGVGATLATGAVVLDKFFGNQIQGTIDNPVTTAGASADSGQKYNGFEICYLEADYIGYWIYKDRVATVYVDNGTGTATTNLTGYKAIERVFHKLMVEQFKNDPSTVQEWFDKPIIFQDPLGAAPTGTADTLGMQISPYGSLNRTNIGTQTIVVPVLNSTGLLIDQDDTATEGSHTSANQQTLGDQSFVIGKTGITVASRLVMGDYTDAAFKLGLRKKAVYGAVINNYTDYATVGNGSSAAGTTWINGDFFVTQGNINSGTPVQAISAVAPADGVSYMCWLKVDAAGVVTAYVDGTAYPIYYTGTTTMTFDAGDELIPFYQIVNIGSGDPACSIGEFFAVASDQIIS